MPRPPHPKRKCSACNGQGWVWAYSIERNTGKTIKYQKSCSACGGTGET